jgi:protein involved in polysaccharide export with SLBB domain
MYVAVLLILIQSTAPSLSPQTAFGGNQYVIEQADRNHYILGPGDMVAVVVEGGCSEALLFSGVLPWSSYTVGSDGYLSVSGIGGIPVDGLTIEEAQYSLQRSASYYYPSISISLSLYEPRMLRASIRGMVNYPGTYVLTSLHRVSDLVREAGGISAYGSRYGSMINTGGDTLGVNLHIDPLTGMFSADPFLTNNTSVVFDVCMNPVFILRSDLLHPLSSQEQMLQLLHSFETWELIRNDTFESLMNRMGGLSGNINVPECRILRLGESIPIWTDDLGFTDEILHPGDTVLLVTLRDSVTVSGAVRIPGNVAYRPESTVQDYIVAAGGQSETASSGISLYRNGMEIDLEGSDEGTTLLPGDAINIRYSWFSRNQGLISFVGTVVSLGITLYAMSR